MNIKVTEKNRINCLLGAGAAIDINGPSTNLITSTIKRRNSFIEDISLMLNEYYGNNNYNFEDVFHAIESLRSFSNLRSSVKAHKPVIGAFLSEKNHKYFDTVELIRAEHDILDILSDLIFEYDNQFSVSDDHDWYKSFWNELNQRMSLDVFTLNYDSTIQHSLQENFNDGFEAVDDASYKRFNPKIILETKKSRVLNLHGQINYGYLNDKDPNRFALEDDFSDLYKFQCFAEAKSTWFGRSSNYAQSGDIAQISPILTGLRKTDKLLTYPMSVYNNILINSIYTNPNLFICGYSFGDKHINKIIERVFSIHREHRKIVLITYINNESRRHWSPDPATMDWLNNDMFTFIAKAFNEFRPFEDKYQYINPLVSKDGRVMIYFEGFKKTIEEHGHDIISFFNN